MKFDIIFKAVDEALKAAICLAYYRIRHKGVIQALLTKCRKWPVPRHKAHIIAQRPEFLRNGINELLVIAARKIRPAD